MTGDPVEVADISNAPDVVAAKGWDILGRAGYRALLAVPLRFEDRILGGLVVLRRELGNFSEETVELVEAFAAQSALAVRNAKLFEEQRRREQELRQANEQLKAAQTNLIHAEKMASLGQLTAGIAHEIKNPLNFVNNFATLSIELLDELKETAAPGIATLDEDARADIEDTSAMLTGNLEKIAEHGRRADGIVKSMLLHSRGGTGDRQTVDLNALVDEALTLAYHGARARDQNFNITMEREFAPDLAPIEVVPQDLTRVFLNLIGNGFYAANKRRQQSSEDFKPTLTVATRDLGDAVEMQGARQRRRHSARSARQAVPAVLHDKADRRGHRPRPVDQLRDRDAAARRHDIGRQRARGVYRIHRAPAAGRAGPDHGAGGVVWRRREARSGSGK